MDVGLKYLGNEFPSHVISAQLLGLFDILDRSSFGLLCITSISRVVGEVGVAHARNELLFEEERKVNSRSAALGGRYSRFLHNTHQ